ncbi:putative hydrolase [Trichinella spiralis]|uniref:putative hydrolase n=1 Tax=Trichinella spiralis TaxID=6334 RepID=UPI0001EFE36D|nr:putative hydrolase [Trichinella spiralis]
MPATGLCLAELNCTKAGTLRTLAVLVPVVGTSRPSCCSSTRRHHAHCVFAKETTLIIDELLPESQIWPHYRPASFDHSISLAQRHPFVFDQIRDTKRSGRSTLAPLKYRWSLILLI